MRTKNPRKPKLNIPITYSIGWWSHQNSLSISGFELVVVESNLNAFITKSLIRYKIKGTLIGTVASEPFIEKIHVSERIIERDEASSKIIIELTPIVKLKSAKKYRGDLIFFEHENEHIIQSPFWGSNTVIFTCDKFVQQITLHQGK